MISGPTATRHEGRWHIALFDWDGDAHFHGVIVFPESVTREKDAMACLNSALYRAKKVNPDEWDYDDVIALLVNTNGCQHICCGTWVEAP